MKNVSALEESIIRRHCFRIRSQLFRIKMRKNFFSQVVVNL